jgi:ABC-type Fe3+/spermidine/putrescine transport system ATPase subunit
MHDGERVLILVRPEEMSLQDTNEAVNAVAQTESNHITGIIELRTFLGPFTRFHVRVNETTLLTADLPNQQARDFYVAQPVTLSFVPGSCQVLLLDATAPELERLAAAERV